MSGEQRNLEESLKPFFGWNNGALHFFNSTYYHSNYEMGVNGESKPETLFGTPTEFVMFAKNYNEPTTEKPNDVHHQYIDFVAKTALFHREIDRSTSMGSGMIKLRDSLRESIELSLNQEVSDVSSDTRNGNFLDNKGVLLLNTNLAPRPAVAPLAPVDVSFRDLNLNDQSNFFDYIVAYLFMLAKQINNPVIINDDVRLLGANIFTDFDNNRRNAGPVVGGVENGNTQQTVKEYLDALFGTCQPDGTFLPSANYGGNYCVASVFGTNSVGKRGRRRGRKESYLVLDEVVNNLVNSSTARRVAPALDRNNIMITLLDNTKNVFTNCLVKLAQEMFSIINIREVNNKFKEYEKKRNQINLSNIVDYYNEILNRLLANRSQDTFKECVIAGFFSEIKKQLGTTSFGEHTFAKSNEWTRQVIEQVFDIWNNLSPVARTFYGKHMHLFAKRELDRGVPAVGAVVPATDYVDLMPTGKFTSHGFNRKNLRINLMKARGVGEVLFGETLPWLPVDTGKVGMGWYTASNGNLKSFKLEKDSIRKIYNDLYKTGVFVLNGRPLDFPKAYADTLDLYENKDFDINDMQIIYNSIRTKTTPDDRKDPEVVQFEDLFEDLATNDFYRRDENGLFKMMNGQKVYAGMQPSSDNCASTHLNNSNNTECVRIVRKCLIDGDKNELAKCLDELRDNNLFDVAQKELEGIHPEIAIKILKTFGIGGKSVNGIHVVESLNEWMDRTVSRLKPDVRDAIVNNMQLRDYISGVIAFVNANPAIMNKNLSESANVKIQAPEEVHQEDVKMCKELYRRPKVDSKKELLFTGLRLGNYASSVSALPPSLVSMSAPDFYTNSIRGRSPLSLTIPGIALGFGQMGGGLNSSKIYEEKLQKRASSGEMGSALLEGLIKSVVSDLERAGKTIKQSDLEAMMKGINQIKRNEEKLIELYVMMRSLVDLSDFFKSSCAENVVPKEISIRDIRNRSDTIAFLKDSINKMEDCIDRNVNSQHTACNGMIQTFASIFETAGQQ